MVPRARQIFKLEQGNKHKEHTGKTVHNNAVNHHAIDTGLSVDDVRSVMAAGVGIKVDGHAVADAVANGEGECIQHK